MKAFPLIMLGLLAMPLFGQQIGTRSETLESLADNFDKPRDEYRPHVWWHWLGSNFSKEGITKDLESMKEAGIGGATIFNIASSVEESHHSIGNNPWPEQTYRSKAYWEAIEHTMKEAKRLGLTIGLHGTPGYSTTGGPWITEERSMKALISSKIEIEGGRLVEITLSKPELPDFTGFDSIKNDDYKPWKASKYWDVSVMAVPAMDDDRVNDILELTAMMDSSGHLKWQAPKGKWVIYRYGYASTMAHPHPLPDDLIGKAWEVDKMSREDNIYHWRQILDPLKEHIGEYFGTTFTYIWIDSYESGYQNWTPTFREDFIRLKGYDPLPWVALYQYKNNKELGRHFTAWSSPKMESSLPEFKVFLKDYDDVVNRLYCDNGWKTAKEILHEYGLELYWEPYTGPFSTYEGAMLADLPVGEFWNGPGHVSKFDDILRAASDFNKRIVAAEALTGQPKYSKYTEDPAFLKHTIDEGYAAGYNLYFLHHWVHQPFDDKYQPGIGMGWWGTHFSRFQTWYEPGKAMFKYMARCQMMLQQGDYIPSKEFYAHRRTPEADIFFIINEDDDSHKVYKFPIAGREPQLWDPYEGNIHKTTHWEQIRDSVFLSPSLEKGQSMFVVFPNSKVDYAVLPEIEVLDSTSTEIKGLWDVTFKPKLGMPFKRNFHSLADWSKQRNPDIKYFAGTATYRKSIQISPSSLNNGKRIVLDLGGLDDIAELSVNEIRVGVLWAPPYRTEITSFLRPGKNILEISVTNNWANRLIGDEQYPADFEWGSDRGDLGRAMKAFPEWFLKGEPRPSKGRKAFTIWYYYRKDSPLQPAGLHGPVRLITENVRVND